MGHKLVSRIHAMEASVKCAIALALLFCVSVLAQFSPFDPFTSKITSASFYGVTNQPVFWLRADAQTLNNGDAVTSPIDSSGRGTGATFGQSSAGVKPTFKTGGLNGLPSFWFDGGDCLTNPSVTIGSFTLFSVASNSSAGFVIEQSANATPNSGFYLYMSDSCSIQVSRVPTVSNKNGPANYGIGRWILFRYEYDGTDAGHILSTNGVATGLTVCGSSDNPGSSSVTDQVNLGARNNGAGVFLTGHVSEWLLFSPALTGAALTTVASNIQARYFP